MGKMETSQSGHHQYKGIEEASEERAHLNQDLSFTFMAGLLQLTSLIFVWARELSHFSNVN